MAITDQPTPKQLALLKRAVQDMRVFLDRIEQSYTLENCIVQLECVRDRAALDLEVLRNG